MLAIKTTDEGEDYQRAETFLLRQLKRQIQLERAAEERRVFYVACTRARDQLVLSLREGSAGWVRDPEGGSSVPADWIRRAIRIERDSNRDGSSDLQAHFQSGQAESVKVLIPS